MTYYWTDYSDSLWKELKDVAPRSKWDRNPEMISLIDGSLIACFGHFAGTKYTYVKPKDFVDTIKLALL